MPRRPGDERPPVVVLVTGLGRRSLMSVRDESVRGIAVVGVRTAAVAEPVGDVAAVLGEGPYWVPEDDCLLWVDIHRG